ncbi:MAG: HD domain-containing protein [Oceanobacter sp.]
MKPQYRISLTYLCVGVLWVFFSDQWVDSLFESKEALMLAQNIKGWLFIVVTAGLLFLLVRQAVLANESKHQQLLDSYDETIRGWIHVMDVRHKETRDHTVRVTRVMLEFARCYGITDDVELQRIERGAILHDIGKVGIPDQVLTKPGRLNEEEMALIRQHPKIAADILQRVHFLRPSMDIPLYHHEHWNGQGYPYGLSGQRIPVAARLFAIVDTWDALSHNRVYKQAWSERRVLDYLSEQSGTQFDPEMVEVFQAYYQTIKQRARVGDDSPEHSDTTA